MPAIALIAEETPAKERAKRVGEKETRIATHSQTQTAGGGKTHRRTKNQDKNR